MNNIEVFCRFTGAVHKLSRDFIEKEYMLLAMYTSFNFSLSPPRLLQISYGKAMATTREQVIQAY